MFDNTRILRLILNIFHIYCLKIEKNVWIKIFLVPVVGLSRTHFTVKHKICVYVGL